MYTLLSWMLPGRRSKYRLRQGGEAPMPTRDEQGESIEREGEGPVLAAKRVRRVQTKQRCQQDSGSRQRGAGKHARSAARRGARICQRGANAPDVPGADHRAREHTVEKVVVVAERHEQQRQRCGDGLPDARLDDQPQPAQDEERYPLQRHELEMSFGVREVVLGEREHIPGDDAAPVPFRDVQGQPECRQARHDEGEDDDDVVGGDEAEEWLEQQAEEAVERVQGVPEKRDAGRMVKEGGVPGRRVQFDDRFSHPPEIPDVLKPVPGIGEKVRGEAEDQRVRQQAEREK